MRLIFILIVLAAILPNVVLTNKCRATHYANSKLVSGPSTDTVNVTVTELDDRYVYSAVGFVLGPSDGGPNTSRGMLIIPEQDVDGAAYAPYAHYLATIGHHVVLLKSITGRSDREIYGLMTEAFDAPIDIKEWAIMGHGKGAVIAAKYARIDNGHKVKGLVLLAAAIEDYVGGGKRNVVVSYGHNDRVVPDTAVLYSLSEYVDYEAYIEPIAQASHMDYAYSLCTDDDLLDADRSLFHFDTYLPVFDAPVPNSGRVQLNDIILRSNRILTPLWSVSNVKYYDNEWKQINIKHLFSLQTRLSTVNIMLNTNHGDYADNLHTLDGKRVRLYFKSLLLNEEHSVDFYISSTGDVNIGLAKSMESSLNMLTYTSMGLLAWRGPDQRGLYLKEDYIISRDTVPEVRWYVWENETATRGILFFVGGAIHPNGYGGIAHLLQAAGYTVIIPASPVRYSMLSIQETLLIIDEFDHLDKWSLAGHSMGGFSASAAYAFYPSAKVDSIFMYGGVMAPFVDLQNDPLPVLNIFGTLDATSDGGYMRYKDNFGLYNPDTTTFEVVEGANHYYIGDYGDQQDAVAEICREEQQSIFVSLTVQWLTDLY